MPIRVQIAGDRGLVWDIEDILKLRRGYRLVGCMVGSISRFQSQVAVMGLPLQLSPEEVSMAAAAGWIELYQLSFSIPTAATAAAAAAAAAAVPGAVAKQQFPQQPMQQPKELQQHQQQQQQQQCGDPMQCNDPEELDEFYAAYYGLEAPQQEQQQEQQQTAQQPMQQQQKEQPVEQQQQQQQRQEPQAWQLALKASRFPIPMTVADAAAGLLVTAAAAAAQAQQRQGSNQQEQEQEQQQQPQSEQMHEGCSSTADAGSPCQVQPVTWQYPLTPMQWLRLSVFSDLHSRGFCVTGGAKFGGDFLAYPGDPHLYHAQYVIRVVLPDQVLVPSVLQGLARGVHAARKHLVLATVQPAGTSAAAGVAEGAAAAAAVVGGLAVMNGVGPEGGSSDVTAAAAAVSAAAVDAACQALFAGVSQTGPVQLGAAAVGACGAGGGSSVGTAACGSGVLRYITIARETGWGGD